MNANSEVCILHLLNQSIQADLDLISFCEEFVLHYVNLNDGKFKDICKHLFHGASDYIIWSASKSLTPQQIQTAFELFELMKSTLSQLTEFQIKN